MILAIESAVSGGSVSLLGDKTILGSWVGDRAVSTAESLLPAIDQLLADSGADTSDISRIAVSLGPGSYTGVRIGIATAAGLSRALRIPYIGVSGLHAVAAGCGPGFSGTVAFPFGKRDVVWESFLNGRATGKPEALSLNRFELLLGQLSANVFVHSDLWESIYAAGHKWSIRDIGKDLSKYVALAGTSDPSSPTLEPIYVQRSEPGPILSKK